MGWGDSFWIGTAFGFRPNQRTKDYNIWFSSGIVTEFLVTWNHFFSTFLCLFHNFLAFLHLQNWFFAKRQHKHVLSFGNSLAYWGQNTDRGGGKDKGGKQRQTRSVCLVFCVLVFVPLDPLSLFSKTRCSGSLAAVWAPTSLLSFLFAFSPVEENPCSLGERDKG